jgi:uncharacterized protein DUF3592
MTLPLTFGWGGVLLCGAGAVALLWAGVVIYRNRQFVAQAAQATGTVTAVVMGVGSEEVLYFPVVRFQTRDGQAIEFTSGVGSSPSRFKTGQPVSVIYNPQQPQKARLNSGLFLWGGPTLLIILGCGLGLLGLVLVGIQYILNRLQS